MDGRIESLFLSLSRQAQNFIRSIIEPIARKVAAVSVGLMDSTVTVRPSIIHRSRGGIAFPFLNSLALFLANFSAFRGRTSPVFSSSQKEEGTRPKFSQERIHSHPGDPEIHHRRVSRKEGSASSRLYFINTPR